MIQGAWRGFVADRRLDRLAADSALQTYRLHQPLYRTASNLAAFPPHLPPDLARAVDLEILCEHTLDIGLESSIPLGTVRPRLGVRPLCRMVVIGRWGDRQDLADRLDRIGRAVIVDERDHGLNRRSSSA
jgi:hypothetical protein